MMTSPTRRTLRTVVQVVTGLALALPVLVTETGLKADQWPWLTVVLAVAAAVTRLMASPTVDALLADHLPWLATAPAGGRHEAGRPEDASVPAATDAGDVGSASALLLLPAVIAVASLVPAATFWTRPTTPTSPATVHQWRAAPAPIATRCTP